MTPHQHAAGAHLGGVALGATPAQAPVAPPPERFNFAQHLLACNAVRADKLAFVDDIGSVSYGQLEQRVRRLAAGLRALGLRREERVLLLMQDCADWPVSFLGAVYAGLIPVAVNTLLTADDYAYMLENSRAQAVLVSGALLPALTAAMSRADHEVAKVIVSRPVAPLHPAEVEFETFLQQHVAASKPAATGADDPAFWLYSSGSTGRPKGTVHSQANPYWTAELYGKGVLKLREDDVCFSAAKLFFAYGLGNGLSFPMSVGATTVLMPERPTPEATFARWLGSTGPQGSAAAQLRPTVFFGAPTGFAGMLAHPQLPQRDALALRLVSSAGEALPAELGERFKRHFGVDIVDGIGSTEMLHIFLSNRPEQVRYGTTGWPVPGYRVELRGEDGAAVPDGEPGDLYIHGPSAAMMYWGNRAKTRETFQGGWTKSGDKYVRNADGSYTYSGRSDDMLKVSGIYVSPFEVEATLVQHPAVLEAAVVGKEDVDGLVKTKAFVVLKAGAQVDEPALKAFVKDRLAPYKYPRFVEFVAELPKTATGKIQRFKLRELEAGKR
jgi:benzoate-CoA ligase